MRNNILVQIRATIYLTYHGQHGRKARVSLHEDQTEFLNDVPDSVLAKPEEQPERHVLDYPRFVYRYVKKEANIFLRVCGRHGNQFIARLEPDRSRVIDDEIRFHEVGWDWKTCFNSPRCDSHSLVGTQATHNVGHSQSYEQSMLVNVVQLIQDPEILVPSLVRSCAIDDVQYKLSTAIYFSSLFGVEFIDGVVDWEARDTVFRRTAIYFNQVPNQVVESAPERVQGLPSDNTHLGSNNELSRDVVGDIPGFFISFNSDNVTAFFSEPNNHGFKLVEMLLGPLQLGFDLFPSAFHEPNSRPDNRGTARI